MREIALDTETTGLQARGGDKITEIGCIEIIDKKITGRSFHAYVNPEREVSQRAAEISGLTYDFLKKFKTYKDVHNEFVDFIGDDRLVIHNAGFDIGFLNAESSAIGGAEIDRSRVIDTLSIAKQKFPGAQATLDALCKRFSVDRSARVKHGALIDARLLAEVYIHMSVEFLQKDIFSADVSAEDLLSAEEIERVVLKDRNFSISADELEKHSDFLKRIKDPVWKKVSNG